MIKLLNKADEKITFEISGDILPNDFLDFKTEMGMDLTVPNEVKDLLNENKDKEIIFNINSNGGDVFSGTTISNIIKSHKGKTVANIQSVAASIASVIALSCDEIKMPKNAYLMIHKPYVGGTSGTSEELRATADLLDKIQDNIEGVYMEKVKEGIARDKITSAVNNETWFTGIEASSIFNIDLLDEVKILNCSTEIKHKNQPTFKDKVMLDENIQDKIKKLEKWEV